MDWEWKNPAKQGGDRLDFGHLGGTSTYGDPDSWFPELWDWLYTTFKINSVLDVGCGIGHAMKWWLENTQVILTGLDCQQVLEHHVLKHLSHPMGGVYLIPHDLTTGPRIGGTACADLVWCCEVAEHIAPEFVDNIVQTLAQNTYKVLALCAAQKGAGGYHHVNCQDSPYWIEKLTTAGLKYNEDLTQKARELCPAAYGRVKNNYFHRAGLIFTRGQE